MTFANGGTRDQAVYRWKMLSDSGVGHHVSANRAWQPMSRPLADADVDRAVVVHFWAGWNGYDRQMDELLGQISGDYEADLLFASCDIGEKANWQLARQAHMLQIPALVLVVKGKPLDVLAGLRPEPEIRTKLDAWRALARSQM